MNARRRIECHPTTHALGMVLLALVVGLALPNVCAASGPDTKPTESAESPIGFSGARHLLSRAEFGASPSRVQRYAALTREAAVDKLLAGVRTTPKTTPPEWTARPISEFMGEPGVKPTPEMARERRRQQRQRGESLKAWWYGEMLETESALTERMTLHWHNHFTSSLRKVKLPHLLFEQNQLFRTHAVGNFRTLLHAIVYDPAMVLYLDTQSNKKGKPNENFARELMELFTLGEGHYTEEDIKEAARAFTGIKVRRRTGESFFAKRQHDYGKKKFFGREGHFEPRDIVNILLEQEQTAEYLTERLWKVFVSPEPDAKEVQRIAKVLRDSNYELKPWLRALLLSDSFWDPAHRGTLIKSPVELIVGTARTFGMPVQRPQRLVRLSRGLGQDLLDPPNVKGWPGGEYWISSATLVLREQYLARVFKGLDLDRKEKGQEDRMAPLQSWRDAYLSRWFEDLGDNAAERSQRARELLLPLEPIDSTHGETRVSKLVLSLVLDPTYQLK